MLCLDTYALVEIHDGRLKAPTESEAIIPNIVLAEFYGQLYRKYNKKTAEFWAKRLQSMAKEVSTHTMINAMEFKVDNVKKKLSFFDCVGYVYARENKHIFVTGDKEFKNMEGVLYVK